MKWESLTLGELCQKYNGKIQTGPFGSQLHQSDYREHGTPVIMPKDIVNDKISLDGIARIEDKDVERLSKHILKVGDIVFPRRGEINKRALIRAESEGMLCGTGCLKISIKSEQVSNLYLNYYLARKESVDWLENNAVGSTMKNISGEILSKIPIELPSLPTQQKIASILSAYDDLIENNLKRIRLLEEAAQNLYREWFVRFRFPGWEEMPVVDGLPEGWERKAVSEAIQISPPTRIKDDKPAPFVPMTSLSENAMVISPIEGRIPKGGARFINRDTLFARITPCLENGKTGFVQFMEDDKQVATGSTEFIVLRETEKVSAFFIYCLARYFDFREHAIKSMSGSDGRQRVKSDAFDKYFLAIPPKELMKRFERIIEPFFKEIQVLAIQNQKLKAARDLLLPRLMNQTIEV